MAAPQSASPNPLLLNTVLLHATSAVTVAAGVFGAAGGVANDTQILQVVILKNAGSATLTIAGFKGEDGTARNVVLTGSTTADVLYSFDAGALGALVNTAAALTFTASVADTCLVSIRPA